MVLDEKARMYAFELLTQLRAAGYQSEMDFQGRGFKGQFKAADRAHAKHVLIIGGREFEEGVVTVKTTETRTQETVAAADLVAYLDGLDADGDDHHHHDHEEGCQCEACRGEH